MVKRLPDFELSRPLKTDKIPQGGIKEHIIARPEERVALAKRLKLLDLLRFEAHVDVDHERDQMLVVSGSLFAEVVQQCVVTLEPVTEEVRERFDLLFAPAHTLKHDVDGNLGDAEAELPEPIENGLLDLGEIVSQQLAMAINPYPRKEGAVWQDIVVGPPPEDLEVNKAKNPFVKLRLVQNEKKTD
ncbi:MAG: DUF177 domain-containing protein [Alphaproteobacteria bacterium]|jgi:uncharacterized metal-binding protein YceD (DUF177 family)|nr:DUF177 domain-containing protein [Alphaproteobacteria bacterium]